MTEVLRVTAGNAAGAEIPLGDELLIGRAAPGDGTLGGDIELSRKHALITRDADGLRIEDLGSTNGTFVNGTRVMAPTPLRIGDTISLGASTLEVGGTVPPDQKTSERVVPAGTSPTHVKEPPPAPAPGAPAPPAPAPGAPPPPAPPAGAPPAPPGAAPAPPAGAPPAPPPGAPPPGAPPGAPTGGPPPAAAPPGGGGPPGGGPPADMKARMRRMMLLAGVVAFLLGFGIATLVWVVL